MIKETICPFDNTIIKRDFVQEVEVLSVGMVESPNSEEPTEEEIISEVDIDKEIFDLLQ